MDDMSLQLFIMFLAIRTGNVEDILHNSETFAVLNESRHIIAYT